MSGYLNTLVDTSTHATIMSARGNYIVPKGVGEGAKNLTAEECRLDQEKILTKAEVVVLQKGGRMEERG